MTSYCFGTRNAFYSVTDLLNMPFCKSCKSKTRWVREALGPGGVGSKTGLVADFCMDADVFSGPIKRSRAAAVFGRALDLEAGPRRPMVGADLRRILVLALVDQALHFQITRIPTTRC